MKIYYFICLDKSPGNRVKQSPRQRRTKRNAGSED